MRHATVALFATAIFATFAFGADDLPTFDEMLKMERADFESKVINRIESVSHLKKLCVAFQVLSLKRGAAADAARKVIETNKALNKKREDFCNILKHDVCVSRNTLFNVVRENGLNPEKSIKDKKLLEAYRRIYPTD